jgi:cbb3-type cytochrome oxidase maturation protein
MFWLEASHNCCGSIKLVLIINTILMSALYLLVLASIAVAAFFLLTFIWSVRSNQFEDKQGSAMRMLYDDEINQLPN